MKASEFSESQKAFILKQGTDGMPVADICPKAKQLKDANGNLKRIAADLSLNAHRFITLDDARPNFEDWRRYYNEERPH